MLTRRQKYDYRDVDRWELKLIRVGHAVWALFKQERAANGPTVEQDALLGACQQIWAIKRQVRAELSEERKAAAAKWIRSLRET